MLVIRGNDKEAKGNRILYGVIICPTKNYFTKQKLSNRIFLYNDIVNDNGILSLVQLPYCKLPYGFKTLGWAYILAYDGMINKFFF